MIVVLVDVVVEMGVRVVRMGQTLPRTPPLLSMTDVWVR